MAVQAVSKKYLSSSIVLSARLNGVIAQDIAQSGISMDVIVLGVTVDVTAAEHAVDSVAH